MKDESANGAKTLLPFKVVRGVYADADIVELEYEAVITPVSGGPRKIPFREMVGDVNRPGSGSRLGWEIWKLIQMYRELEQKYAAVCKDNEHLLESEQKAVAEVEATRRELAGLRGHLKDRSKREV